MDRAIGHGGFAFSGRTYGAARATAACGAARMLGAAVAGTAIIGCGESPAGPGDGGRSGETSLAVIRVGGDGQAGVTDAPLGEPLVVRVEDGGGPRGGVQVSWSITDSAGPGARLTRVSARSDSSGRSSAELRLGSSPGRYEVAAALGSAARVVFTATASARTPATLTAVSGNGQSGTVGTALAAPFAVEVRDQVGDPLEGALVRFVISRGAAGNPAVEPDSARTDTAGRARTVLTLGDRNGTYGVRATGPDTVEFLATASGGADALLAIASVSPDTLVEGDTAHVVGEGFGPDPAETGVWVNGRPAAVLSATVTDLRVLVPSFDDRCLPPRPATVQVARGPDSAAVSAALRSGIPPLELAPGDDTVLVGPDEVGCVQLPPAVGGEEYEVVATLVGGAAAVTPTRVTVSGSPPPGGGAVTDVGSRAGAVSPVAGAAEGGPVREPGAVQLAWDARLRRMEAPLLPQIRARAAASIGLMAAGAPPAVGDSADFDVSCTFGPPVRAVARSVSDALVLFEDTAAAGAFTPAQYDSIAADFDTLVFATDTTYFGVPADIDGNGRVVALFTPAVNELTPGDYSNGYVAGYFCGADLIAGFGNGAEMFYVAVPDSGGEFGRDHGVLSEAAIRIGAIKTLAHEFQHLINAQTGGGGASDPWLNEGLSHLAEEVSGHRATGFGAGAELSPSDFPAGSAKRDRFAQWYAANFRNLSYYLAEPSSGEGALLVTSDPGASDPPASFRMRGASWSFVRYLLDRFGEPGTEASLTRALVRGSGSARSNISDVFGVSFEELVADWHAMLVLEDRSDIPTPGPDHALASYRLRALYEGLALNGEGLGNGYLLDPARADAAVETTLSPELFTGTGQFITIGAAGPSGGAGLRFAGSTGDLLPGAGPRLVIVRTK